jgi:Fe-S cluster assembly protein SufD
VTRTNPVYTEQVDHYAAQQDEFAAARSTDPGWLVDLRASAMARFVELGFPSTRLEEWRYTNVAPIARLALELGQPGAEVEAPDAVRVASLADRIREAPDEVRSLLASASEPKDRAFALLNTAFLDDGIVVTVAQGTKVDEPILLRLAAAPGLVRHPRLLVRAEPNSRATILLDHCSPAGSDTGAPGLTNVVADVSVGAGASIDLVVVQREANDHFHVSSVACALDRSAHFNSHVLSVGGALVRNDLEVVLGGEGSGCELRGLFLGSGSRVVDNHTAVDHAVPHCSSNELYKGILGGRSRGVFRGRVVVRPDAQKTDALQSNPNLLLGNAAEIDSKPQLEIYADDVKCSHGATVGQLEEDALFYLQSRGIGLTDARALMVRAFANEIIDNLPTPGITDAIAAALRDVMKEEDSRNEGRA